MTNLPTREQFDEAVRIREEREKADEIVRGHVMRMYDQLVAFLDTFPVEDRLAYAKLMESGVVMEQQQNKYTVTGRVKFEMRSVLAPITEERVETGSREYEF